MGALAKSPELLKQLGKFKTGGVFIYKKLDDIDTSVLKKLIKSAVKFVIETYAKAKAKNE
jgi:hypothetical protein